VAQSSEDVEFVDGDGFEGQSFRPMFTVFFAYHATHAPSTMNFAWLPLEIGLYGICPRLGNRAGGPVVGGRGVRGWRWL
jgi:hypothetical protein